MPVFLLLLLMSGNIAWSNDQHPGLQVNVRRDGSQYALSASFDTSLSKCAAYHYLTDYESATNLPGVVKSETHRQSAYKVTVDRTVDEHILLFSVRLRSVMEYTENPIDSLSFTQLSGSSKMFQGTWDIEPTLRGSTLRFKGLWEPDTVIPLFVIDHFAKNGLVEKFNTIAQLAEKRKDSASSKCTN